MSKKNSESNNNNNNNKNKRDEDVEEDNVLKKQKTNNNSEEGTGSGGGETDDLKVITSELGTSIGGEIDITNLKNKTNRQLKEIQLKLGITPRYGFHYKGIDDIIERIQRVYKRKQDTINEKEINSGKQECNNDIKPLYKIKECIDASEWSFWKIFRNKVLYRKIMSFMDTHLSIPYDSIISITNMINCNQLGLLRDKVIRNQYLVFGSGQNKFKGIFNSIRNDDDQDRLFYQQLFNNYGHYSMELNNMVFSRKNNLYINENGRKTLANEIISSNCIPALQVLIEDYQFEPTNKNLNNAIEHNRFKFVKLLLEHFNLQIGNTFEKEDINIKILNYLYDKELIDNQMVETKLKRLSNIINIEELQLKSLIIWSILILKCNNVNTTTIEHIETFSNNLTKQELKSSLSDVSNQTNPKKEMIKQLLEIYYSFLNVNYSQFYYIYFSSNGDETFIESNIGNLQNVYEVYKSFLRFADLSLVSFITVGATTSKDLTRECFNQPFGKVKEPDYLFSYCQDKEKQLKFLKFNIDKIKEGATIIDPTILFNLVIYNDDLDQIKYFAKELGDIIKECTYRDGSYFHITNYIRSKLVLEWLFENYFSYFIVGNGVVIWYFRSVELLQHYEQLYQSKCKFNVSGNNLITLLEPKHKNQPCDVDVLKHIFRSGSNVYFQMKTESNTGYSNLFTSIIYSSIYGNDNQFEMLKLVFSNSNDGINQLIGCVLDGIGIKEFIKPSFTRFIDWVYRNYQDQFNNSEILMNNQFIKNWC